MHFQPLPPPMPWGRRRCPRRADAAQIARLRVMQKLTEAETAETAASSSRGGRSAFEPCRVEPCGALCLVGALSRVNQCAYDCSAQKHGFPLPMWHPRATLPAPAGSGAVNRNFHQGKLACPSLEHNPISR